MRARWILYGLIAGLLPLSAIAQQQQDNHAQALVRAAVQTEIAADRNDHSRWQYRDLDRKPGEGESLYQVVETDHGAVKKKLQQDGRPLDAEGLRAEDAKIWAFVNDPAQQAKQRKDGEQDDKRAEAMMRMLPDAFLWSIKSDNGDSTAFAFTPDPNFNAPNMEARVFSAMAGELVVNKAQNRIQTIKGKLIRDVKFGWGLLGHMNAGGTFNVERREIAPGIWAITESHVHIDGKALLFKTISEQEDEVKSQFRPTPKATTLEQAANILKAEPTSLSAER
jgi:hypothetical protein